MARLDTERQDQLEPKRIDHAVEVLSSLGFTVTSYIDKSIKFEFKGETVTFFPYSGWHTGKSITDGRGFKNLLKQLQ